jgi:hypothetical protein
MGMAIARHAELVRSAVEVHGGYVFSTGGDGFGVAFARAGDAIAAAVDTQRALAGQSWPAEAAIGVRMGLHTGEADERDGNYFGAAVNRTARLMALAHGGQVVVSAATADVAADMLPLDVKLVDLGEHLLRDLSRREHVFQVEAPGLGSDFAPLRSVDAMPGNLPVQPTSFVGRSEEARGGRIPADYVACSQRSDRTAATSDPDDDLTKAWFTNSTNAPRERAAASHWVCRVSRRIGRSGR